MKRRPSSVKSSHPFSLRCLRSSMRRGLDRIRSVHVGGPSSVHSPYVKATAGLLNRRCNVQMRLWMELQLVNSPGWSLLLAGVAGAVFLRTGLTGNTGPSHDKVDGCVCKILRELGLCMQQHYNINAYNRMSVHPSYIRAYSVFTNRILHCINTYVIRIINCHISSLLIILPNNRWVLNWSLFPLRLVVKKII